MSRNTIYCYGDARTLENVQHSMIQKKNNADPLVVTNRGKWNRGKIRDFINKVPKPEPKHFLDRYRKRKEKGTDPIIQEPLLIESFSETIDDFGSLRIVKISCTYNHSLILMSNGDLYSFGDGMYGKLGNGETSSEMTPVKIMENVTDMDTGSDHSAAVSDGKLYCWGSSEYGQCGHGSVLSEYIPKVVDYFVKKNIIVVKVTCGEKHTIALASTGLVYGFGSSSYGQLGILCHLKDKQSMDYDAQLFNQCTPKIMRGYERIPELTEKFKQLKVRRDFFKCVVISCGQTFSAMIDEKGKLFFCGENICGVGGQGHIIAKLYQVQQCLFEEPPKETKLKSSVEIKLESHEDRIQLTTEITLEEIQSPVYTLDEEIQILQVACGWGHLIALDSKGNLYGSGLNINGQLGLGVKDSKRTKLVKIRLPKKLRREGVKHIACGQQFSAILSNCGHVYVMGMFPGCQSDITTPTLIPHIQQAQYISCGKKKMFVVVTMNN